MGKEKSRSLYWEELPEENPLIQGRNYLLLIGINDYQHINPLQNAVKDIQDFLTLICERYQFEEKDAVVLLNEEATRENIIEAFERLTEVVEENDNLIIYFAGHGTINSRKRGFWIPYDAQIKRTGQLIYNTVIRDYVADIVSRHTLLIVDSCFSGAILRKTASDEEVFANRVEGMPSRWLLTSGRNEVVSDGLAGKNSPFAHCLLTFLRQNQQGKLPVSELVQHVKKNTPRTANQTPYGSYMHGVGDQHGEMIFHLREVDTEEADWEKAKAKHSIPAYFAFRKKYPHGEYYQEALGQIRVIEEDILWKKAQRKNRLSIYLEYLDEFPRGRYIDLANQAIEALQSPQPDPQTLAWQKTEKANTYKGYQNFLDQYDTGDLADKARFRMMEIEEVAWQAAMQKDTENTYRTFYRTYPQSTYYQIAVDKVNEMKEVRMWEETNKKDQLDDYKTYLKIFPYGGYASEAKKRIEDLSKPKFPIPEMVFVKGGKFWMGSEDDDPLAHDDEKPIHEVEVSDFYIGKYPVTVSEYLAFCKKTDSHWPEWLKEGNDYHVETGSDAYYKNKGYARKGSGSLPIVGISWNHAFAYCEWLSSETSEAYHLPTEAEWEYAAGGEWEYAAGGGLKERDSQGKRLFKYSGSSDIKEVAWHNVNSNAKPHPVGQKKANGLGIHDMSGNVWEWCGDWFSGTYYRISNQVQNPKGPDRGDLRVVRGGSWYDFPYGCRAASRSKGNPYLTNDITGFRLLRRPS